MYRTLAIFFFLLKTSIYCAAFNEGLALKIVGGRNANISDYPYQVSLQYQDQHVCGGVIITPFFVITAAHCTLKYSHDLQVRAGTSIIQTGGQLVNVSKIHQHPKFIIHDYDISILELETPLKFTSTVQPLNLPQSNQTYPAGTITNVTGWGSLIKNGPYSKQLQVVNIQLICYSDCKEAYKGLDRITDRMFCAGVKNGGKDTCQGDSGSPLVINRILVGIVSFGSGCGNAMYPGVYTNVTVLREFIRDITGI